MRDSMHANFNNTFGIDKQFETREDLKSTVIRFGKEYNVVFSIQILIPSKDTTPIFANMVKKRRSSLLLILLMKKKSSLTLTTKRLFSN
jgi:hypothetical protein